MSRRRRLPDEQRDQVVTTFTLILDRLLDATPSAVGVALVDAEGEAVDYAGALEPFDIKIAAATWAIVMADVKETKKLPVTRQLVVRARGASYIIRPLHDWYSLVLVLYKHAAFAVSERALQEAHVLLSAEAGFPTPDFDFRWTRVDVETTPVERLVRPTAVRGISMTPPRVTEAPPSSKNPRRMPSTGAGWAALERVKHAKSLGWQPIEVMGALVGARTREQGFRIRLATGHEMTLVCERSGHWFVDERFVDVPHQNERRAASEGTGL